MGQFSNKVAIVTGGAQGMGRAYVRLLAERGANVVLADINADKAVETAESISGTEGRVLAFATDVGSPESTSGCAAFAIAQFGGIDYLVNNAGLLSAAREKPLFEIDYDKYLRVFAVNTHSIVLMTQAVLPSMLARGGGAIVNTTSIGAWMGKGVYSLTKAAANALTVGLAKDLMPQGIRMNAVAPGSVETEGNLGIGLDLEGLKAVQRKFGAASDRVAQPEEIAAVGLFLLSDEASFISGQILAVDGGAVVRL